MFDTSKHAKFHFVSPYELLLYVTGHHLWVATPAREVRGYEDDMGFEDPHWTRDSHCVLVKKRCTLSTSERKELFEVLINAFELDEYRKILLIMIKFFTGTPADNSSDRLQEAIDQLHEIGDIGEEPWRDEDKTKALECWFDNFMEGPLFITRSLSKQKVTSTNSLVDCVTTVMRQEYDDEFYKFDLVGITILDSRYYAIPAPMVFDMEWPSEVEGIDFVGITGAEQEILSQPPRIVHHFNPHHIDGYGESAATKYTCCVCKKRGGHYLSVEYGVTVFWGVLYHLLSVFNSIPFNTWAKSNNLDVWCGREEKIKLEDVRSLKERIKKLTRQNRALIQKLSEK